MIRIIFTSYLHEMFQNNIVDLAYRTFKLSATKVTKTNASTASYFCAGCTCILKFVRQVPIYRILCVTFFFRNWLWGNTNVRHSFFHLRSSKSVIFCYRLGLRDKQLGGCIYTDWNTRRGLQQTEKRCQFSFALSRGLVNL